MAKLLSHYLDGGSFQFRFIQSLNSLLNISICRSLQFRMTFKFSPQIAELLSYDFLCHRNLLLCFRLINIPIFPFKIRIPDIIKTLSSQNKSKPRNNPICKRNDWSCNQILLLIPHNEVTHTNDMIIEYHLVKEHLFISETCLWKLFTKQRVMIDENNFIDYQQAKWYQLESLVFVKQDKNCSFSHSFNEVFQVSYHQDRFA